MKVLTVKAPWTYAIFRCGKDIENRPKPINYRGSLLIHTSKNCTSSDWVAAREYARFCGKDSVVIPDLKNLPHGFIYGVVDVVGCEFSEKGNGAWGMPGYYHWKLANPRLVKQVFYKGQLGLWDIPDNEIDYDCSKNPLALEHGHKSKGAPNGDWIVKVWHSQKEPGKYSFSIAIGGGVLPANGAYSSVEEALQAGVEEVYQ